MPTCQRNDLDANLGQISQQLWRQRDTTDGCTFWRTARGNFVLAQRLNELNQS